MTSAQPIAEVEIYFSAFCPFCRRAKALLDRKQVPYTLYDVDQQPRLRQEMTQRSRRTSVPQIFINQQSIGGCDDVHALDRSGRLDALLSVAPH